MSDLAEKLRAIAENCKDTADNPVSGDEVYVAIDRAVHEAARAALEAAVSRLLADAQADHNERDLHADGDTRRWYNACGHAKTDAAESIRALLPSDAKEPTP